MRKPVSGVSQQVYTNHTVQPQSHLEARNFRFGKLIRGIALCSENKVADALFIAQLICTFVLNIQKAGFLTTQLKFTMQQPPKIYWRQISFGKLAGKYCGFS